MKLLMVRSKSCETTYRAAKKETLAKVDWAIWASPVDREIFSSCRARKNESKTVQRGRTQIEGL